MYILTSYLLLFFYINSSEHDVSWLRRRWYENKLFTLFFSLYLFYALVRFCLLHCMVVLWSEQFFRYIPPHVEYIRMSMKWMTNDTSIYNAFLSLLNNSRHIELRLTGGETQVSYVVRQNRCDWPGQINVRHLARPRLMIPSVSLLSSLATWLNTTYDERRDLFSVCIWI